MAKSTDGFEITWSGRIDGVLYPNKKRSGGIDKIFVSDNRMIQRVERAIWKLANFQMVGCNFFHLNIYFQIQQKEKENRKKYYGYYQFLWLRHRGPKLPFSGLKSVVTDRHPIGYTILQ